MTATQPTTNMENIGWSIDRLMTIEMRISTYARGVIHHLYRAAVEAQNNQPLSLQAAQALQKTLKPGDAAFLLTGAGNPDYLPCGETDGPPGVAALAAALSRGLGVVPLLFTEQAYMENLQAVALAAGLGIRDPQVAIRVPNTTAVLSLASDETAEGQAKAYLEQYKPRAVISIEKLGPNSRGVQHSASGKAAAAGRARAEYLFNYAQEAGILTIGVGDNGNEMGYGLIEETVRRHKPYGDVCQCPCGGGLATSTKADVLVAANTSNWGAYGIEAALAALLNQPALLHTAETEQRMIEVSVATGAADGSTGRHILAVDGMPLAVQTAVVSMLKTIVENGVHIPTPRPF